MGRCGDLALKMSGISPDKILEASNIQIHHSQEHVIRYNLQAYSYF